MLNHWHAQDRAATLHQLGTDPARGLEPGESTRRLREHGPNVLPPPQALSPVRLAARRFVAAPFLLLVAAAAACAWAGAWPAAAAVAAAAALVLATGLALERRAGLPPGSLRGATAVSARVVRGGRTFIVPAAELVAGDLVVLAAGERVPADLRLVAARGLVADESVLTGVSLPAAKDAAARLPPGAAVAERANMLYAGTEVTAGDGTGVVVATGTRTEFGGVATLLGGVARRPPALRLGLDRLGRRLGVGALAGSGALAGAAHFAGSSPQAAGLAAASLAVAAALPGLPTAIAAALALGVRRLGECGAAVRTACAPDTLGQVAVLCTTGTRTLTLGQLTARELYLEGAVVEVGGVGCAPEGTLLTAGRLVDAGAWPTLGLALRAAVLCSGARLRRGDDGPWEVSGDPEGGALLVLAAKGGVWSEDLASRVSLVAEFPASAERRRATVLAAGPGASRPTAYTRGAPGAVLAHCLHHRTERGVRPLSPGDRERILRRVEEMSARALRVLGLAYREDVAGREVAGVERAMVWLGLVGLADPPRPESPAAIAAARACGVRPVIVTGEPLVEALALARAVGALGPGEEGATGEDLDRLTPEALAACVDRFRVFARVTAGHRLRVVRAWKRRGVRVAMAGDALCDAPALREADLGIATGPGAPEATRDSADLAFAGAGFEQLVAALAAGKDLAGNIRGAVACALGGALGAGLAILAAGLAGLTPLPPQAALWSGLVAGGLPALALALGPPAAPGGREPPGGAHPVDREGWRLALAGGAAIALATLAAYLLARFDGPPAEERARASAFAALGCSQIAYALTCVVRDRPLALRAVAANPGLVVALASVALLTAGALQWAPAAAVFSAVPLGGGPWLRAAALGLLPLAAASLAGAGARERRREGR